jgi:glycyl-radical enzyme activating protein
MSEQRGRIFEVQRFCIHDGPGIRTTVFMQGCPLRCLWCHNPEGISPRPLLSFQADKCVDCGWCLDVCESGAHDRDPDSGQHTLNRASCTVCGACAEKCYAGALEIIGYQTGVDAVLETVMEDAPFYTTSGGGMTLSGGEPLAQPDFARALLQGARTVGIHCAVETCGAMAWAQLERIAHLVDLFLFDIKESDPERHRRFTGVDNGEILANLRQLHAAGAAIRLRLPLVPSHNDRPDHFDAVAALVHELPRLCGVEIMPYHRLGTSKSARFGWPEQLQLAPPSPETVARWIAEMAQRDVVVLNPSSPAPSPQPESVRP